MDLLLPSRSTGSLSWAFGEVYDRSLLEFAADSSPDVSPFSGIGGMGNAIPLLLPATSPDPLKLPAKDVAEPVGGV
jgi:hypothetical protein